MLYIGLATSLVTAFIAMRQNDIKKVLAYSTVSQLGFIFVALGMGAYTAAIFHVTTHAFFKALLFLGSGSVIHAMSDEQDIRKMGGLKKFIPITNITFLIGTLAISGFPLLSGFFSKDEILAHAMHHNMFIYVLLAFSALLTAIYMFRLYFVVFHGEFRGSDEAKSHLHESPLNMTLPLIVLAVLSVIGGLLNIPSLMGGHHWFSHLLNENVAGLSLIKEVHLSNGETLMLMISASLFTLIALFFSYSVYVKKNNVPLADNEITGWTKLSANKLYFDEVYNALFVKPIEWKSTKLHQVFELFFLNGIINFITKAIEQLGELVKKWQSGKTDWYILWMVFGIVGLVIYYLVKI
jgi:NADH-quinone oxidoreductase subunit L